ncbi:glycosyltransferase [Micromonosporaceae bacterium B7E4]
MIVFVVECPSPYHTPVLNRLQEELGDQFCVFYLYGADTSHGWGHVAATHRYIVLDHLRGRVALAKALLSPKLRAVGVYGYRGLARLVSANVARLRGLPLVLRGAANVRDESSRPAFRRLLKRWYLRMLVGQPEVWTNGSANTAYWRLLGLRRHHLIPYALQQLPGNESGAAALRTGLGFTERFVFTFVGRLEPIKGVTDLLQAYDVVRQAVPAGATALVIVGSGSLEPQVRQYVDAHDDCRYLGTIPQQRLGAVYAAADVFVAPSHREPWGWVINEALGFGTRVIASVEMASADDLCTEETGRRCPVADPPALASAMLAEYWAGPRRARRLECMDTARLMADRLRELTGDRISVRLQRLPENGCAPDAAPGPDMSPPPQGARHL